MAGDLLLTLFGIALLVIGGETMVRGASSLALRLGISPLTVGLTVVAFGTSAPELAVNVSAALRGNAAISFGNVFGSNMANIGLIVACTALVHPLQIHSRVISREVPMMMLGTLVATAVALDGFLEGKVGEISRVDGVVLLLVFTVFLYYTLGDLMRQRNNGESAEFQELAPGKEPDALPLSIVLVVVGFVGLAVGGSVTVSGATGLARALGVSEAIIGLSIVAVGTSLPELVATVTASLRGAADMAIGNVVGSNIFNLLFVLGATSVIAPVPVPPGGAADLAVVVLLSALLWLVSRSNQQKIVRTEALLLLVVYLGYLGSRVLS